MEDNIVSASVPVTLDGRDLILRYRAHAFIQYAEHCGGDLLLDIREMGERLAKDPATLGQFCGRLVNVLWAGLNDVQPEIRREDIGRMFCPADFGVLLPAIMRALQLSLPEQPPANARPTKAVKHRVSPPTGGPDSGPVSETATESLPVNSAA